MQTRLDLIGRFDAKAKPTPQGGLRALAFLTRTGVLLYQDSNGRPVREYRPPEEVFTADSLASLRGAPVTIGHVAMVDTSNWRGTAVGFVADDVRKDGGRFVAADIVLTEADTIRQVQAGELVELSCGYTCDVIQIPGETPDGERFDAKHVGERHDPRKSEQPAEGGLLLGLVTPSWRRSSSRAETLGAVRRRPSIRACGSSRPRS